MTSTPAYPPHGAQPASPGPGVPVAGPWPGDTAGGPAGSGSGAGAAAPPPYPAQPPYPLPGPLGAEQNGYAGCPDPGYAYPEPDRLTRWITRRWSSLPVWAAPLGALACMGAAAAYTEISHPTDAAAGDLPTCLLKYTTGFDCPGCGGTRAAWYLLHGNLPAAARHNAVFVFAVPFLLYIYVAWAGRRLFGWRLPQLTLSPRAIGIFLAVWGVWSVLRNLPWAPFTYFYV